LPRHGHGTTVACRPLRRARARAADWTAGGCFPAGIKHVMGKTEILIIDDEQSVADALKVILESEGFSVTLAATGREGVERARQGKFRLAITDLRLPDMSGLEVLQTLRAENSGLCVILITSYGTPAIVAEALGCGAEGTLDKPFAPSEIIRLITSVLERTPDARS